MRVLLLLVLLGLGALAQEPQPQPAVLTLRKAVFTAFELNPTVRRKDEEALAEEAAIGKVRAEELPRMFGESVYKDGFAGLPNFSFRGLVQTAQLRNWGIDGVLSWTYDFGRSGARTKAAQHNAWSAKAEAQVQQAMIAIRVVRAYNEVLLAGALLALEERNVETRATVAKVAQARYKHGTISRVDVGLAEASLAEAKVRRIRAANDVLQARAWLANSIGVEKLSETLQVAPAAAPEPPPLEDDVLRALERRPEMDTARERIKAGEQTLGAANAGYNPSMRFLFAGGYIENRTTAIPNSHAYGVALTFPIYTGGAVESEQEEAEHRLKSFYERASDQAQTIRLELTRARLLMDSLQEARRGVEERVKQAADSERLATLRYEHGMGHIVELQQAQTALLSAQTEAEKLKYDTLTAVYVLRYTRGEILEEFGGAP